MTHYYDYPPNSVCIHTPKYERSALLCKATSPCLFKDIALVFFSSALLYQLFVVYWTIAWYCSNLKSKTKAPSSHLVYFASCPSVSLCSFMAPFSKAWHVLAFISPSFPIPSSSSSWAFAPAAPPKLLLSSYWWPTLSFLIQRANLSPQLTCLTAFDTAGHSLLPNSLPLLGF